MAEVISQPTCRRRHRGEATLLIEEVPHVPTYRASTLPVGQTDLGVSRCEASEASERSVAFACYTLGIIKSSSTDGSEE